jgi:hypothetical protein
LKYFATVLAACLSCGAATNSAGLSTQQTDESDYLYRVVQVVQYLRSALGSPTGVRLSYAAKCGVNSSIPPLPAMQLRQPPSSSTGLSAVRLIFESEDDVSVTKGLDGVIEIKLGKVSGELLDTKIADIRFDPIERYNPRSAISALERTAEMKRAMDTLEMRSSSLFYIGLLRSPENGGPSLPSELQHVTTDRVFDKLAQSFRGLVTYGVCTQGYPKRLFFIDFVGMP